MIWDILIYHFSKFEKKKEPSKYGIYSSRGFNIQEQKVYVNMSLSQLSLVSIRRQEVMEMSTGHNKNTMTIYFKKTIFL